MELSHEELKAASAIMKDPQLQALARKQINMPDQPMMEVLSNLHQANMFGLTDWLRRNG